MHEGFLREWCRLTFVIPSGFFPDRSANFIFVFFVQPLSKTIIIISPYFFFLFSFIQQPETVPQAIIDMNRVVEVSEAEEVTGHPFSLALTAADRVHFLKGTSREESKWWFDILSMFPRTNMKVCATYIMMGNRPCDWPFSFFFFFFFQTGRHKRNATFPGSKATTIISTQQQHQQSTAPNSPCLSKGSFVYVFSLLSYLYGKQCTDKRW